MGTYRYKDDALLRELTVAHLEFGSTLREVLMHLSSTWRDSMPITEGAPPSIAGAGRLIEDLHLTISGHAAAHILLAKSLDDMQELNIVEPAALIIRQVFEGYLEVAWIIAAEPPKGIEFPTSIGDPKALSAGVTTLWPDEEQRRIAAYINAYAVHWIDFQALRCHRKDIAEQRKLRVAQFGADCAAVRLLDGKDLMIRRRLEEVGVPTGLPPAVTDIASNLDPEFELFYRTSSSEAHLRMVSRNYRFGPPTEGRRLWLAVRSNAILADVGSSIAQMDLFEYEPLEAVLTGPGGFAELISRLPDDIARDF